MKESPPQLAHLQDMLAGRKGTGTPPAVTLQEEGPSLVVFSGGTAFNSVAGDALPCACPPQEAGASG